MSAHPYDRGGLLPGAENTTITVTSHGRCPIDGYQLIETSAGEGQVGGRVIPVVTIEHVIPPAEVASAQDVLRRIAEAHIVAGILNVECANREQGTADAEG